MPIFRAKYNDGSVNIKATDISEALAKLKEAKPSVKVKSVESVGVLLNTPASFRTAKGPTWTSKSGKTRSISKIKIKNLKAIEETLYQKRLTDSGIYKAVVAEIASR